MKVFVISLPNAAERRERVIKQFDEMAVSYEFFDALTGADADRVGLFEGFDEHNWVLDTGRASTAAEIGCFASHRELWKRCIELDEPIMIFEDDFDVSPAFPDALEAADRVANNAGYLRLQADLGEKKIPMESIGEFTVSFYKKAPHCMMCYCISPAVARHFVEITRICDAPVDVFMKKYWQHGQAIYALTPFVVDESVLSKATMIPNRIKAKKKLNVKIRRFARKVGWYLRRWTYNYRYVSAPLI